MPSQSEGRNSREPADLAGELAKAMNASQSALLDLDGVRDLLEGLTVLATAVTRVLDELRGCPVLIEREHELGLLAYQTIHSKLEQAAAAAEDLEVTTEALCQLLPGHAAGAAGGA